MAGLTASPLVAGGASGLEAKRGSEKLRNSVDIFGFCKVLLLVAMGSKKRQYSAIKESNTGVEKQIDTAKSDIQVHEDKRNGDKSSITSDVINQKSMVPMERKKKRKEIDKKRHRNESESKGSSETKDSCENAALTSTKLSYSPPSALPGFHIDVFRNLASANSSVREAAAEALVTELIEVQKAYELMGKKSEEVGNVQLEADKDDGLKECAPSLRYAIRRLIRGVSSSRECARQGFSLGLTVVMGMIPSINLVSVMKLIVSFLEVSSAMKGQEAKDFLLGRLFAYGSIARSNRLAMEWISNKNTSIIKEFTSIVISLAEKKHYLHEPAVAIILDMVEKLPVQALKSHVLLAPGIQEWVQKAAEIGDPDALVLALNLQERVPMDMEYFGNLLPSPFTPENFFSRECLQYLERCFKESTFCLPRVHNLWHLLLNMLVPDTKVQVDAEMHPSKKNKKNQKCSFSEATMKNVQCFCEVVIDSILLQSSHDRKHLALNILELLLPRLPASCINSVLSYKFVHCLMDVLSNKTSWLYDAAQHFVKELLSWAEVEDDRCAAVILSLQRHSNGRFDCISRTRTVKELLGKFRTMHGGLQFVQNLINLFVDEVAVTDEPSDQSQATDENSEVGLAEDRGSPGISGNTEFLKCWVIDTMPCVLRNLKIHLKLGLCTQAEIGTIMEQKFKLQMEITKFLAVQGLFSASLGTEVTSFELQEKFKWPKVASSCSLCKMCIEQLQLLLEDAQKEELGVAFSSLELNDLGSYFMCFLKTLCNIPSVSLYRTLSQEDKKAFNRLQAIESRLYQEERNTSPGLLSNKLHAMRYLLIQMVLQILLHPDDFSEAALDFVICCKKAFPAAANCDFSEDEDSVYDNDMPNLMDVLVETLLSVLPRSSVRMCYVVEQVFRFFCGDITDYGVNRMLCVLRKDLKPLRHPLNSDEFDEDDDDDDDDILGIEDTEEVDGGKIGEISIDIDHDDTEEVVNDEEMTSGSEDESKNDVIASLVHKENGLSISEGNCDKFVEPYGDEEQDGKSEASDDSDSGMDDDAMFRMDAYHAQLLKERSGNDNAISQLISFKLRVLSLLQIYLTKHPGKSHVLSIYSCLVRAYAKYYGIGGNEQVGQRINVILRKKLFKAKEYPRGDDISLTNLEKLLEKGLKTASRSRVKDLSSLAQASVFWLLKIVQSRNVPDSELARIEQIFQSLLVDFFNNKNCRLKSGFIKEVFRRHQWLCLKLLGSLLEKTANAKSEYRQIEALGMVDSITKSLIPNAKDEKDKESRSKSSKLLKEHLPAICELIKQLLTNLPGKQSRRAEARRFCIRSLQAISTLKLKKSFLKAMKPEGLSVCESHLGNAFLPFKMVQT
ncbi:hypothetical protein HPP92_024099 [Vanilla planifolia]|uniref:DNA polymerase V n=1 Tax=Vanilla planifolia TaxID=51239 RepID=A0A835UAU4_VANPL|nr:hypothetical protein HPP92_024099 [Vanilla planifolia]